MIYDFEIDFDQIPLPLRGVLPTEEDTAEYNIPPSALVYYVEIEFDVDFREYFDEYTYFSHEEVVFETLKLDGMPVPVKFASDLLRVRDLTPEEMLREWESDNAPEPNWL